jgi:hypothetical protein
MSSKIILFKKKTMFFSPSHPRITLLIDPKKQQKKYLFMSSTEINIIDKDKKKKKKKLPFLTELIMRKDFSKIYAIDFQIFFCTRYWLDEELVIYLSLNLSSKDGLYCGALVTYYDGARISVHRLLLISTRC